MKPSNSFVALTRNPESPSPKRFEPTVKKPGELVLTRDGFVKVRPADAQPLDISEQPQ